MKIEKIELSWFRGGSASAELCTSSRNVLVYGSNGSGKSSFVDAIEYVIGNEKIEHLAHEYSGHKQILGIRNTSTPDDMPSRIALGFDDASTLSAQIDATGHATYSENPDGLLERIRGWNLRRTVLRQDEVADFIEATKGEKYSVVLPLLGLSDVETVAENLRKLRLEIEDQANLTEAETRLQTLTETTKTRLGGLERDFVLSLISDIERRYNVETHTVVPFEERLEKLEASITNQTGILEPTQQTHLLLKQVLDEDLDGKQQKVAKTKSSISKTLDHKIQLLIDSEKFVQDIEDPSKEIECPTCGRAINCQDLTTHIAAELTLLQDARSNRDQTITVIRECSEAIARAVALLENPSLQEWIAMLDNNTRSAIEHLKQLAVPDPTGDWTTITNEQTQKAVEKVLLSVRETASLVPPSVQKIIEDLKLVQAAKSTPQISKETQFLNSVRHLLETLEIGEENVRQHLKSRVEGIISECSSEVQRFWGILHPDEPIEDIRLTISEDKAIDVELKFFGRSQRSPRLTLSESHRNSLGLCIFLALASLEKTGDIPIVLDDIVSSLDRDHRGRLAEIIEEELKDRQVLLFTHDREWYSELRNRLSASKWAFLSLRPWHNPDVGIQFSKSVNTFDDARSIVSIRPESAGNTVRSIMDSTCAIAAEHLQIRVPFLRGDENERRSCVDLLDRIIAEARKRLKRSSGAKCDEIIGVWDEADRLLRAWANRSSHTGSLLAQEATKLIDTCEMAVRKFECADCQDPIWIAYVRDHKRVQCSCGKLYWDIG